MIAVDTNVVLRFLIGDDPAQAKVAERYIADGVYVSHGVLMEAEWVLRSVYKVRRQESADLLAQFIELKSVELEDRDDLRWAVERYRSGADWADLLHIIAARPQGVFASFEKRLAEEAGPKAPVTILSLA